MNDVAAAVFLAQSVVDRTDIEEQQGDRNGRLRQADLRQGAGKAEDGEGNEEKTPDVRYRWTSDS